MAVSVQVVVISQLLLIYSGTVFSSVHSLNAVRVGGLMLACVNGLFAVYTVWYYQDDPAGAAPCSTLEDSGGSGSGLELRLVNDYSNFYGLVVVNMLMMGLGVAWYTRVGRSWIKSGAISGSAYCTLASVNSTTDAKEVDYPIVKARLEAAERLLQSAADTTPFVFDLMTIEKGSGQQLEQITLDMVLESKALAAPNGVRLLEINVAEKSGLMVLGLFETIQEKGVRSWKTCWLPCCEKKYGVERSWKACWRPKERAMARVDIAGYHALEHAPEELRDNRGFVLAAVKANGYALQHASEELRNDREIVLAAVKQFGGALRYASPELQHDPEMKKAAGW
eukprot:COSAG06_NODE_6367_length_2964_cov_7.097382_2_plen_338_part_00